MYIYMTIYLETISSIGKGQFLYLAAISVDCKVLGCDAIVVLLMLRKKYLVMSPHKKKNRKSWNQKKQI